MPRTVTVRKRGQASRYLNGNESKLMRPSQPGDEIAGGWTREQLLCMDADFCAAMNHAIKRGLERSPEAPDRAA
jgi:hypothetical protein